jgi:hypothetical protein
VTVTETVIKSPWFNITESENAAGVRRAVARERSGGIRFPHQHGGAGNR